MTATSPTSTLKLAQELRHTSQPTIEQFDALEESADHDGLELQNSRLELGKLSVDLSQLQLLQRTCQVLRTGGAFDALPFADKQLLDLVLHQCPTLPA
jgi:hypothetical protein